MPPKKKKAAGNAAAGEKVFKNLCGVCHSLSVSITFSTSSRARSDRYTKIYTSIFAFLVTFGRSSPRWITRPKYCIKWRLCILGSSLFEGHNQMDRWQSGQVAKESVGVRSRKCDGFRGYRQSQRPCRYHSILKRWLRCGAKMENCRI